MDCEIKTQSSRKLAFSYIWSPQKMGFVSQRSNRNFFSLTLHAPHRHVPVCLAHLIIAKVTFVRDRFMNIVLELITKTRMEADARSRPSVLSPRKHGLIPEQRHPSQPTTGNCFRDSKDGKTSPRSKNCLGVDQTKERILPSVTVPVEAQSTLN